MAGPTLKRSHSAAALLQSAALDTPAPQKKLKRAESMPGHLASAGLPPRASPAAETA